MENRIFGPADQPVFTDLTRGAKGSATELTSGFGKLVRFGFDQPALAMCGDSTFFHAAMPAFVNAHYNQSNLIMVILNNRATAVKGFQPHPGGGVKAMGGKVCPVKIEGVCRAYRARIEVTDSFEVTGTQEKVLQLMEDPKGPKVLIMRRECAMMRLKEERPPFKVNVNADKHLGGGCGCNRLCIRVFNVRG